MTTAVFNAVRAAVTARQAAEAYGLPVNRSAKTRCVWHSDKNPSLSFRDGYCHCFACGAGGSSIDLTAQLFGLTPLEAAYKLAQDFHVPVSDAAPVRAVEPSSAARRAALEAWRTKRWSFLCDVEREAHEALTCYPRDDWSWENTRFRAILQALSDVQIELERLWLANDPDEIEELRDEAEKHARCA